MSAMLMTLSEVLVALADGKALEIYDGQSWSDCKLNSSYSISHVTETMNNDYGRGWRYRIKRTPREWWVNVYGDVGDLFLYQSKELADSAAGTSRTECVHVREVLE